MAIKTKSASKVEEAPAAVASMNPDNMLAGGLKDDFDGEVVKARLVPWDYDGNLDHHILAVALTVQPDDENEPFVQHYSCGELEQFVPSMDGKSPVDLENGEGEALEGIYALRVGKKEQLNNNTNWAHFVGAVIDAGFPKGQLGAAVTFIEGTYGHWNRVPQKKRSGIVVQPQQGENKRARSNDILVITEIKEKPAGAKKPAAGKSSAPAAAANGGDLDDRLREVVTEAVLAAGDTGLPKAKLAGLAIKAFAGAEKAKAVKRVSETAFLESSETWAFDADSGTLFATA
jgi:hypothetical protein